MRSREALEIDWTITAVDHVGSRMVYFFGSQTYGDEIVVRISVSRIFADPENEAWRKLDETVK